MEGVESLHRPERCGSWFATIAAFCGGAGRLPSGEGEVARSKLYSDLVGRRSTGNRLLKKRKGDRYKRSGACRRRRPLQKQEPPDSCHQANLSGKEGRRGRPGVLSSWLRR